MAVVIDPTAREQEKWRRYLEVLPPEPRAVAERFEPWRLYRIKGNGQRGVFHKVYRSGEHGDGPLCVALRITSEWNVLLTEEHSLVVLGILPEDLEECELPGPHELVGHALVPPGATLH